MYRKSYQMDTTQESRVVFQYVDCHSANNVLKIDVFQLIICTVILKVFTY